MNLAVAVWSLAILTYTTGVDRRRPHKLRRTRFGRVKLTMIYLSRSSARPIQACVRTRLPRRVMHTGRQLQSGAGSHTQRDLLSKPDPASYTNRAANGSRWTTHNHQCTTHNVQGVLRCIWLPRKHRRTYCLLRILHSVIVGSCASKWRSIQKQKNIFRIFQNKKNVVPRLFFFFSFFMYWTCLITII